MNLSEAVQGNSSFSLRLPGQQIAVDSTSLGEFKICPRRYFYGIVCGYQPATLSPHLTFGLLLHWARERYDRARVAGEEHENALRGALHWTMKETWNARLRRGWISDHPAKNRESLIRTVVWFLDLWAEGDPIETLVLADGSPAVELSFRFDSEFRTYHGETVVFCGHLDRIGLLAGEPRIVDVKTTGSTLDARFFSQFTPGNQFSMYALAGRVAFGQPIQSLVVDGVQVGATFARFQRGLVARSEAQLDEWLRDSHRWLRDMEDCAIEAQALESPEAAWPMNDKACDLYGGCPFREVCSRSPAARPEWLARAFRRRVWDPLVLRGDV